jgi:Tol biopolymer transport system component
VVEDTARQHLVAVDREGKERVLFSESARIMDPRVDPSGRRIAFGIGPIRDPYFSDVWTYDLVTGTRARLTFDSISRVPIWTADGRRVAYVKGPPQNGELMTRPWDGTGSEESLGVSGVAEISIGQSGRHLAVRRGGTERGDIWVAPLDSLRALEPFLATPETERAPAISPDGSLLAYVSGEPGVRVSVYVRPLERPGAPVSVSGEGIAGRPAWSPDGRELFYRVADRLIAATITTTPELAVTAKDTLLAVGGYQSSFDVLAGAREFLFVRGPQLRSSGFFGIVNWTDELLRRSRAGDP